MRESPARTGLSLITTTFREAVIRALLDQGKSLRAIAEQFGVNPTTIWAIRRKGAWKHVIET